MTQVTRGLYRHYKGGIYRVLGVATHTERQEQEVIYQSVADNRVWARPVGMFAAVLEDGTPRFEYLGAETADIDLSDIMQNRAATDYLESLYQHFLVKLIDDFDGRVMFGRLVLARSRIREILVALLKKEAQLNAVSSDNVRQLRQLVDQMSSLQDQVQHVTELLETDETAEITLRSPKASPDGRITMSVRGQWSKGKLQVFSGRTLEETLYRATMAMRKGVVQA